MMSNGQPSGPMYGRRQHDLPYNPPPMPYQQHPYPGYPHQHMPQPYPPQPHPPWAGYYNMQPPMQRPYPGYPPMMSAPYPMPPQPPPTGPSMSPRPGPPQHVPSPSSMGSHLAGPSPSMPERPLYPPPPAPAEPAVPVVRPSPPPPPPPPVTLRTPFYPKLPWYSVPERDFPRRSNRRRRAFAPQSSEAPVELPVREEEENNDDDDHVNEDAVASGLEAVPEVHPISHPEGQHGATTDAQIETAPAHTTAVSLEGPSPVDPEIESTNASRFNPAASQPSSATHARQSGRANAIIPVVPNIPSLSKAKKPTSQGNPESANQLDNGQTIDSETTSKSGDTLTAAPHTEHSADPEQAQSPEQPPVKIPPKSWADLVRNKASGNVAGSTNLPMVNTTAFTGPKNESLADALLSFEVKKAGDDRRIPFLKPRGLFNTGNMCYMNSVLQILVSCLPFYDFLDQIGRQASHSFKSDTPMLDAMIMFLREFPVIDSATSVEQLNMRLKDKELEEYGDAFIPEFVYEVIRRLPRFASMRRGHQQDAEEFLGFLLEQLHEECVRAMRMYLPKGSEDFKLASGLASQESEGGWLEVGPKQKSSITRSSGISDLESPITKIFGGKLRSELRVPGAKNSVTLEPYQPLQLDIGSPHVNNIIDALKNLTKPETLHGDFNSPRGPGMKATKQVSVETLPPVLILHLKRFQYDNAGGTQKIWKKIGYPLDLEIPKEVFPPHKRGGLAIHGGLPKYRLVGVVYHHGKIASGGHYTVDVRRQNEREWIRLDDTVIRRIRSEDVAEGGSEEDPKVLAAALEQHKRDQSSSSNIFDQVREETEEQEKAERGWSQVNGGSPNASTTSKKWSGVVNGNTSPPSSSGKRTPVGRSSIKDNKVAYLLFYQKLGY